MTSTEPLVSVIIPAYNAERYLVEAVQSIINQSYKNTEIIIIDDGSTDRTSERIIQLANLDPRIRSISQHNLGIAAALNAGIQSAKGEFIARMDADDIAFPERLKIQLDYLIHHHDVDLISAGYVSFKDTPSSSEAPVIHPAEHEQIYALLAFCSPLCHPCVVAKTKVYRDFPYRGTAVAEDHDLWCRAIQHYKFANLEVPLLYYRRHATSATAKRKLSLRMSVFLTGLKHILRDRWTYRKSMQSLDAIDRTRYRTINWKRYDVLQSFLRIGQ